MQITSLYTKSLKQLVFGNQFSFKIWPLSISENSNGYFRVVLSIIITVIIRTIIASSWTFILSERWYSWGKMTSNVWIFSICDSNFNYYAPIRGLKPSFSLQWFWWITTPALTPFLCISSFYFLGHHPSFYNKSTDLFLHIYWKYWVFILSNFISLFLLNYIKIIQFISSPLQKTLHPTPIHIP